MNPAPTISVVIPVRNMADRLPGALAGLCEQTMDDFEVIVVDDGSDDDVRGAVPACIADRVRVLRQDHAGAPAARNRGADEARADVLLFLDADDEVAPTWLDRFATVFADPAVGLASCGTSRMFAASGARESTAPRDLGPAFDGARANFLAGAFAVRRAVWNASGGYDEAMPLSQNTELGLRLIPACRLAGMRIEVIDEPLVTVRVREDRPYDGRRLQAGVALLERHEQHYDSDPIARADLYGVMGVSAARLGRTREARRHLWRAVRARPSRMKAYARFGITLIPGMARVVWGRAQEMRR